jgi:glycosyltransferase involved in cell wall biosynthesis
VIAGYASRYPAITPIYHAQNQGVAQTRIDALKAVTGDVVTYVDGDDRILPAKLEKEVQRLQASGAQMVFSDVYRIDAGGKRIGQWAGKKSLPQGMIFCQTFARDFPRGILFRHELVDYRAWKEVGFYDPNLRIYEDYDMRIRLTKRLRVAYCDEPLSEYRRHDLGLRNARAAEKVSVFGYICEKNRPLLADLDDEKRQYVQGGLDKWQAHLLRMAAKEALGVWQREPGSKRRAWELYGQSWAYQRILDGDLILGLLLPRRWHLSLRSTTRQARERLKSGGE